MASCLRHSSITFNSMVDIEAAYQKSFLRSFNSRLLKYYPLIINSILISYGVILGYTTYISWNLLVSERTLFLLLVKVLYFLVFVLDLIFVLINSKFLKNYSQFKIFIDMFFLSIDIVIIVHLIVLMAFRRELYNLEPESSLHKLSHSMRILFCISVFRLYKLCFVFKPLLNLSEGIFLTIRSLIWTGVFVFLVIYTCSIMTTWMLNDHEDEEMKSFWGSILKSMFTLFTVLTLEGWNDVSNNTAQFYPKSKLFFVAYVSFTTLTVMNVVTGIILDTFITATENLYAEKFYKGTYRKQFNVSRLVNLALKKMKYPGLLDKRPSRERGLSLETINDFKKHGTLRTYGRYLKKMLSKRFKDNKYNTNIRRFEDLQGRLGFKKKQADSFETKSSEDTNLNLNIQGENLIKKFEIKKSLSFSNDKKVQVNQESRHVSTPNLNTLVDVEYNSWEDNQEEKKYKDEEKYVGEFKRYLKLGMEEEKIGKEMETMAQSINIGNEEIIDMESKDPSTIINESEMEEALKVAEISKYHAYDVLNMYYTNGFKKIKVSEFAISCTRISGNATKRELLSMELMFKRRIDNLENSIEGLKGKIEELIESLKR